MPVFAWRRRMTRHFGEQWTPFAELDLKTVSGHWRAISVQVDIGAVVSVVRRSTAELLGIVLEKGEPIDLAGIGAEPRKYFLHRIPARIGDLPECTMRVAVADSEDAPNLLGRLDVIDRFQMILDPDLIETRFAVSSTH